MTENDEFITMVDCPDCGGIGGFDRSNDVETYDDWAACPFCEGTGKVEA